MLADDCLNSGRRLLARRRARPYNPLQVWQVYKHRLILLKVEERFRRERERGEAQVGLEGAEIFLKNVDLNL